MKQVTWALVLSLAGGVAVAAGDAAEGGGKGVNPRKTTYDFDHDAIEGDLVIPEGECRMLITEHGHRRWVRVRENFRRQLLQSTWTL